MKSTLDERAKELAIRTVLFARDATKEVQRAQYLYIKDAEIYGEHSTTEVIKTMTSEEVSAIADAFGELSNKIDELKHLFHQARQD